MISDDEIRELFPGVADGVVCVNKKAEVALRSLLTECQQHRAEKHERRWRKISEESPDGSCKVAYSNNKTIVYGYCVVDETGITWMLDSGFMVQNLDGVWWRPQLTDLPEGE